MFTKEPAHRVFQQSVLQKEVYNAIDLEMKLRKLDKHSAIEILFPRYSIYSVDEMLKYFEFERSTFVVRLSMAYYSVVSKLTLKVVEQLEAELIATILKVNKVPFWERSAVVQKIKSMPIYILLPAIIEIQNDMIKN